MNFKDVIVPKAWGQEYLLYENSNVGVWHLTIKEGESTSLHAHPNKKTGLIVLEGGAEVSFLSDSFKLFASEKIFIRHGVFHKTTAKAGDVYLLEIETPNNKLDLIRLEDNYGRAGTKYEDESCFIKQKIIQLQENDSRKLGKCIVETSSFLSSDKEYLLSLDSEIFIILSGTIFRNDIIVAGPGDLFYKKNLKLMLNKFSFNNLDLMLIKHA